MNRRDRYSSPQLGVSRFPTAPAASVSCAATADQVVRVNRLIGNRALARWLRPKSAVLQRMVLDVTDHPGIKSDALAEVSQWQKEADKLPEAGPAHKTRVYYRSELASMLTAFSAKPGKFERHVIVQQDGAVNLLARLDDRTNHLHLSHVIARPRAPDEKWPSGSPLRELMTWMDEQGGLTPLGMTTLKEVVPGVSWRGPREALAAPRKRSLEPEVPSLIPLYAYFGFKMNDPALRKRVETRLEQTKPSGTATQAEISAQAEIFDEEFAFSGREKPLMVKP